MHNNCVHLSDLMKIQIKIIKRHVAKHKWFLHIIDEHEAQEDFIEKFGWIMREVYCGHACPDRHDCKIAQEFMAEQTDSAE